MHMAEKMVRSNGWYNICVLLLLIFFTNTIKPLNADEYTAIVTWMHSHNTVKKTWDKSLFSKMGQCCLVLTDIWGQLFKPILTEAR